MTRKLAPGTRVQRGGRVRRPGHETSDAPVGRVLLVMAAFGLLLFAGIGVGLLLQNRFGRPVHVAPLPPVPHRLLVDAPAERRRIETVARHHVDEARLRGAAARGWDAQP
jgi:hypothetical protein